MDHDALEAVRAVLREAGIDGWLLYDFQGQNPIARDALGLGAIHLTRRWYYFIPRDGEPRLLVHAIESGNFPTVPGTRQIYSAREDLDQKLGALIASAQTVAMEYYPGARIPYLSRVDAGTIEHVRALGAVVVSSEPIVTGVLCTWSEAQRAAHEEAAVALAEITEGAFAWIERLLAEGTEVDEVMVQDYISDAFEERAMITDHPPIVAVGPHAGDPHYAPDPRRALAIERNHVLLIDLWARFARADGVYADHTYMAWVGPDRVPERIESAFRAVLAGRDATLALARSRWAQGRVMLGWEGDRAARDTIAARGFGDAFSHRTGHNLGAHSPHGNGPHLDDLETRDERPLLAGLAYTIEPGVYLADEGFGIRSEIDVFVHPQDGPTVYAPIQHDWTFLTAGPGGE